ncbi:MAG TPA: ferredoxin family protein [Candidatus Hydrogenedentes bacterium]|nr:ferredoxin family protein [Candidatus Hydrogenedentota bacterium]HNT88554.1 ferredoxin family protein [Candidatus Hydrogenedentota bacterium]
MNTIIIDTERCKGCYLCIEACPKNCIEQNGRPNASGNYPVQFVLASECIACALCALVCPDVAITVFRHVKEAKTADTAMA